MLISGVYFPKSGSFPDMKICDMFGLVGSDFSRQGKPLSGDSQLSNGSKPAFRQIYE